MNWQESKLGGISSHWKTAVHLDQGVITVSYKYYSNKRSLLFDWPSAIISLYKPIIFKVRTKLTTYSLNMLFLYYKHDLTRTSLNICTENKTKIIAWRLVWAAKLHDWKDIRDGAVLRRRDQHLTRWKQVTHTEKTTTSSICSPTLSTDILRSDYNFPRASIF